MKRTPEQIIKEAAEVWNVKPEHITSKRRTHVILSARRMAIHLMRCELQMSLHEIKDAIGFGGHASTHGAFAKSTALIVGTLEPLHDVERKYIRVMRHHLKCRGISPIYVPNHSTAFEMQPEWQQVKKDAEQLFSIGNERKNKALQKQAVACALRWTFKLNYQQISECLGYDELRVAHRFVNHAVASSRKDWRMREWFKKHPPKVVMRRDTEAAMRKFRVENARRIAERKQAEYEAATASIVPPKRGTTKPWVRRIV